MKGNGNARKSKDLIKCDFTAVRSLEKCMTNITEILAKDGKTCVSAVFDCYDLGVLVLMAHMKADWCVSTIENVYTVFPSICRVIIHNVRRYQHTSVLTGQNLVTLRLCKA